MRTHRQQASTSQPVDRTMLWTLKRGGAQTMEGISSLTGIGWAQVFLSVDRLSRIGKVSLTPSPALRVSDIDRRAASPLIQGSRALEGQRLRIIRPMMPMPMPSRR